METALTDMKRGPGRPSKASMAMTARLKHEEAIKDLTDEQILDRTKERMEIFGRMAEACAIGAINGVAASGAPGIGKSYTAEARLEKVATKRGNKFTIQKGFVTPVMLYTILWNHRGKGEVVVLDDADSVFNHEDSLNLIKAALDSGKTRTLSWMADSAVLKQNDIPNKFQYEGALIFLTNKNLEIEMQMGGKMKEHFEAFINRTIYFDLKLHAARELTIWIRHLVTTAKILIDLGLSAEQEGKVLEYIDTNKGDLRSLSVRTALQLGGFIKMDPDNWEKVANMTLLRS